MGARRRTAGDPSPSPSVHSGTGPDIVRSAFCSRHGRTVQVPTPTPRGLRAARFSLSEETLVVFSYPLSVPSEARPVLPRCQLTSAEGRVLELALSGHSNAAIASLRRVSPRTIANQLASIYRKLGCGSRMEAARLLRGTS